MISILSLFACSQSPEDARKELGQMNIPYSEDAFIQVVRNGDILAIKLFLAAGMNVNANSKWEQESALAVAISNGRTEVIDFLLDKGADPNANGGKPLQKAVSRGSVEVVRKLLEKGATSNSGISFIIALNADQLEIANLLLAKGIDDPNIAFYGKTALEAAVEKSNAEIVQDLIGRGANPKILVQNSTKSLLMMASEKGNKDIIDALLKGGANVNESFQFPNNPNTSLRSAVENKHFNAVKALLAAGADPNIGYKEGYTYTTVLSIAVKEDLVDIVGTLLENKADPNAKIVINSEWGSTPLMVAIGNGNIPIAKLLLQHGANINAISTHQQTSLLIAVDRNNEDAVKFLIQNGADVNVTLPFDRTILDQAYYFKRSPSIINLLVDAGGQARHEKGSAVVTFGNSLKSKKVQSLLQSEKINTTYDVPVIEKSDAVAIVNGKYISKNALKTLENEIAQRSHGQTFPKEKLIEELIQRELLVQDAIQNQLDKSPEFIAQFEAAKKTLQTKQSYKSSESMAQLEVANREILTQVDLQNFLKANPVTDAEIKAEYSSLVTADNGIEYKARHILVKTEAEAKKLITALDKGGSFVKLANKYSLDAKESQNGGDLGWFVSSQMVAPFSEAVEKLEKGKYTKMPVQTQFGWHVALREDSRVKTTPSLDAVKEQLLPKLQRKKIQNLLESLRKKATVEILEPLTQSESKPEVTLEQLKYPDQEVKVRTEDQQTIQASQTNNTLENNYSDSKQSNSSESPPRIMVMRMLEYAVNDGGLSYESQIQQTKLQIEGLPKPIKGDKKTARRINDEALLLFNNNGFESAAKKLTEANRLDPSDVEIINNLGYSYLKQGNLDLAQQSLITVLTMSPGRATAWSNLGDVLAKKGDINRAVACFSNAYRFSKNRDKTYQLMKKLNENEDVSTLKQARSIIIDWAKKTYPDIK